MNSNINRTCRECFNYTPQTNFENRRCCNNIGCDYYLSSTIQASNPCISSGASFQTLLNQRQSNFFQTNETVNTGLISTYNNENSTIIGRQLQAQLLNYGQNRNAIYQRIPPPFIPPSVIQLQMETVNVGVAKPINVCRPRPPSLSYNFM